MEFLKSLLTLLLFIIVSVSYTNAFECDGLPNGNHPNPEDCASFYKCSNGIPYLYNCSKPLLFNPKLLVCDWPQNVVCEVTTRKPETTTESSEEPRFDCFGKPNGLYPNPKECSTFYKCSNGYTYLYNCPGDLYFHPEFLECRYQHEVPSCGIITTKETEKPTTINIPTDASTLSPTESPTKFPTESPPHSTPGEPEEFTCVGKPNGLYPNPYDCRTFYKCSNGNLYKYDCPGELYFHPEFLECRFQHEVPSCGIITTKEPEKPITTSNPPTERPTASPSDSPTDPSTASPSDPPTQIPTQFPTQKPTESPPHTTPGEPEEFTCVGKPDGLYPNPYDCRTFYKCSNGNLYKYDCPGELYFHPEFLECRRQHEVPSCSITPTKEPEKPTTSYPPVDSSTINPPRGMNCTGKPNGLYPNPDDCHTFFMCSNGNDYLMDCPEDLLFDPNRLICDYPDNVPSCGETNSTPEAPIISTTYSGEFSCKDKPCGDYPHSSDCTAFYRCVDGSAELKNCPGPLVFNPLLQLCDLEQNVPSCRSQSSTPDDTPETSTVNTADTTERPTTEAPISDVPEPTTAATTERPTTEAPISDVPKPTTAATTERPTTEAPVSDIPEPTTAATTERPTTEAPISQRPTASPSDSPTGPSTASPSDPPTQIPTQFPTQNPTEGPPQTTPGEPEDFTCAGKPDGLYPNPYDCHTFYECSNGYLYKFDCPEDLYFHPEFLECREQHEVPSCSITQTTTATTERPTTEVRTTEAPITEIDPSTTDAGTPETSIVPKTTTGYEEYTCDGHPNGYLYPDVEDCFSFYECTDGEAYLKDCPSELKFDKNSRACVPADEAVCAT